MTIEGRLRIQDRVRARISIREASLGGTSQPDTFQPGGIRPDEDNLREAEYTFTVRDTIRARLEVRD